MIIVIGAKWKKNHNFGKFSVHVQFSGTDGERGMKRY